MKGVIQASFIQRENNIPDKTQTGSCLCGKVHYNFLQAKVISSHHCHCSDCQKSTGSGKVTIVMVPDEALNSEGNLKFFRVTGTAGSHISRGFCSTYGSPVISFVEENSGIKFIKAGTLDGSSWVSVALNFWGSSAVEWSPADEEIHTFAHNPDLG